MKQQIITEAIVIHPHLIERFMRYGKDFANLLALYTFYLRHAQLQGTNQPLATDNFTHKGLNWALDRVKRIKKILKEMKVIEMVQKQKYTYVRLIYVYTKKKIEQILGKEESKETPKREATNQITKPVEAQIAPKDIADEPTPHRVKSVFEETLIKNKLDTKKVETILKKARAIPDAHIYSFNHVALAKWVIYCEKNSIGYNTNHIKGWLEKLDKRVSIEQFEAIDNAINKKWKNFYIAPIEESKYQDLLGKSIINDGTKSDSLIDIQFRENKFICYFKNMTIKTTEEPSKLFKRYAYDENKPTPQAPIALKVLSKIKESIKRV